jgi:D-sedoheptulose 7-phosphate isomerase
MDHQPPPSSRRITLEHVDGLNVEEGLDRCMNDRDMLESMLVEFAEKFGTTVGLVAECMAEGRWSDAEFLIHSAKGTSGLIGLQDIQGAAADFDVGLKLARETGLSSPELEAQFERYRQETDRFLASIGRMTKEGLEATMSEACSDSLDAAAVRQLLSESAVLISSLGAQADAIAAGAAGCVAALQAGGKILTAGNGGSAAEALHMAEELTGRFRGNRISLPAIALVADCTALTCIANDFGFDQVFSRQVEGLGKPGDVLVLFSTSGNAVNLEKAFSAARAKGMKVLCLIGKAGGRLRGRADWEILVRSEQTERIQEAHQVLLHLILEAVERAFPPEAGG